VSKGKVRKKEGERGVEKGEVEKGVVEKEQLRKER